MTKKDLMTGDIIVNRSGYLGVILKDEDTVLYQTIGSDYLSDFNDDLSFDDEDYRDGDIMQVYRGNTFLDVENNEDEPFYQRDYHWHRPSAEERVAHEKALEEERQKKLADIRASEQMKENDKIFIVAQCFYGNRTGVEIKRADVDLFLLGYTSSVDLSLTGETVDRKVVKVPGTDNVVIVYDQNQENENVTEGHTNNVSCKIPEIDFEIHTRCFACRIDGNGELQSLENDDGETLVEYLPI